jgi:hypothetical protein
LPDGGGVGFGAVLGLVLFFGLVLGYEVPEPVAGSVLEPLRVPV